MLAGRAGIRPLLRMLLAAMAGVAGDALIAVEISLVDASDHGEHLARDYFVMVFIAGEIAHGVAPGAAHAEPDCKRAHGGHNFIGFQDLEILRRTHGPATATWRRAGRRFLSKRDGGDEKDGGEDETAHHR